MGHFKDGILDFDQVEMRFVSLVVKQPQALAIRNRDKSAVIQDHVFLRKSDQPTSAAPSDRFIATARQVTPDRAASL
ncbi:MAG: hypothetical protein E5W55_25310 [Mesorhizobium sp.]|nr:MAG: hypothetical protein E5W55_25310 [Mesorhizobium sp.]